MHEPLESNDVGRTVIRWIVNMLKCRNIALIGARIVKGCPQKGVLSASTARSQEFS